MSSLFYNSLSNLGPMIHSQTLYYRIRVQTSELISRVKVTIKLRSYIQLHEPPSRAISMLDGGNCMWFNIDTGCRPANLGSVTDSQSEQPVLKECGIKPAISCTVLYSSSITLTKPLG